MLISRAITADIKQKIAKYNKAIIITGPRQVGKTTLVKKILSDLPLKCLQINADENKYLDILSSRDLNKLSGLVTNYDLLFIDEAQRIPHIGINLKLLIDNLPHLKIIVTGSSTLDLSNQVNEALTGRSWTYQLYPLAFTELNNHFSLFDLNNQLEDRLIFGSYPELFSISNRQDQIDYLTNISNAYLYKDILELTQIKNSNLLRDLLKLLAFQIGSEVSLSEIGSQLSLSKETVNRYIDLLEKSFVIFRLSGFSRNLRKEISKMDKIYFYDLGIRNILIDNLKSLKDRNDQGQLWENFLAIERLKKNHYQKIKVTPYFWRTYTGAELDLVEEGSGLLQGYEFKYSNKSAKAPKTWLKTYPNSTFQLINRDNYLNFII